MTRIGLVLMLVCAIAGGTFHLWNSREKSVPEAIAVAPRRDVNFGPYMADLQRRIKKQWFPPKANESDKIQLVFKVHSNGSMSNLQLIKASKSARASQAALNAVQKASPFRPLPTGSPNDVDIQFTFDYNVFKK